MDSTKPRGPTGTDSSPDVGRRRDPRSDSEHEQDVPAPLPPPAPESVLEFVDAEQPPELAGAVAVPPPKKRRISSRRMKAVTLPDPLADLDSALQSVGRPTPVARAASSPNIASRPSAAAPPPSIVSRPSAAAPPPSIVARPSAAAPPQSFDARPSAAAPPPSMSAPPTTAQATARASAIEAELRQQREALVASRRVEQELWSALEVERAERHSELARVGAAHRAAEEALRGELAAVIKALASRIAELEARPAAVAEPAAPSAEPAPRLRTIDTSSDPAVDWGALISAFVPPQRPPEG